MARRRALALDAQKAASALERVAGFSLRAPPERACEWRVMQVSDYNAVFGGWRGAWEAEAAGKMLVW